MIVAAREKLARLFWPHARVEDPIDFSPGYQTRYFGTGIGSNQPDTDTLLRESLGTAGMATRAIANRVGSLNPQVKGTARQAAGTMKDETLDDHLLKTLLDRPHPNYSRFQLFWLAAHHIVSAGEAYWLKVRNQLRVPTMLQPMPPAKVSPQIVGGLIEGYSVQDGQGGTIQLAASDVVRMWFPDPETLFSAEGYLGPNAAVADAQKFANSHLRAHYQDDATPATILKAGADATDPDPGQQERFQKGWAQKYHKTTGTHRRMPVFLPVGWDVIFSAIQSGADITPLLEHWQSNQLMNFGVPASVLGRVISGDRSAAETNQYVMDLHTVLPIAMMMSGAITHQLASDFDPNIWVEFEPFVSRDKDYDLKREAQDLDKKLKSVQQVLEDRDEDPDEAPWGEWPVGGLAETPYTGEERMLVAPSLEKPEDLEGEDDPDPDDDEPRQRGSRELAEVNWAKPLSMARVAEREKKYVPMFSRSLRRIFRKQQKDVKAKIEAYRGARALPADPAALFDPAGWGELFDLETMAVREKAFLASAAESLELLGIAEEFIYSDAVSQALRLQGSQMVKLVNQTTAKAVRKALNEVLQANLTEGESLSALTKSIDAVFKGRRKNVATIARTEMHKATQAGQMESFVQAGVPFKTWLDARDSNVRETHFQEGILPVPRDGLFLLPSGATCQYPGDSSLPASESINCRCDAGPVYGIEEGA